MEPSHDLEHWPERDSLAVRKAAAPDDGRALAKAADELGYRTNPMARALPTGKTGMLALLVSDITNPVYFELVRGAICRRLLRRAP